MNIYAITSRRDNVKTTSEVEKNSLQCIKHQVRIMLVVVNDNGGVVDTLDASLLETFEAKVLATNFVCYNEMNVAVQNYARQQLVAGLKRCTEGQVRKFKQMYAFEHLDDWSIEEVVAALPVEKLDWATTQVGNTLKHV